MRSWRDGDPLIGSSRDWSGLARTKKRPRKTIWIRRKNKPGTEQEWKAWLGAAQRAAKLGEGFPQLHLTKAGRKRILTGDLPPGNWTPLFRVRRRRGAVSIYAALEITYQAAKLLEQAESFGIISDKPLQREILFDPKDSALVLCGYWRVMKAGESGKNTLRLLELVDFLCGEGPGKRELLNRLESRRVSGKVKNSGDMKRVLVGELEAITGDVPAGAEEWFKKKRKNPKRLLYLLPVAVTIVSGIWIGTQFIQSHGRPVPNMVGAKLTQAQQKVKSGGWRARIVFKTSSMLPGYVIKQSPGAHSTLPANKQVTLTVSKPAKTVRVPNLVGLDFRDARDTLWSSGLNWRPRAQKTGKVGIVSRTDPPAGSSLPGGFAVTVVYGKP